MNCFEWQSRASDYLDCTLIGSGKRDADEHLEGCKTCNERYKHYRLILTAVAGQPRSTLPVPIRKAPFQAILPRPDLRSRVRARWAHMPWYLRSAGEGAAIVLIILLGISTGPKVRTFYERNVEHGLTDFSEPLDAQDPSHGQAGPVNPNPLSNIANPSFVDGTLHPEMLENHPDEFASGDSEDDASGNAEDSAPSSEHGTVSAGRAEIWRFNVKTDSPQEVRSKVYQVLAALKVGAKHAQGIDAPGGVQFDLLVPRGDVSGLKLDLEKIAPGADAFTWYKSKSRKQIPEGKTRVVIWLSQM